jgi:hypothetical protein
MATEENTHSVSINAAADLSAETNLYRFVSVGSGGTVNLTGNGARADGVLTNVPASGQAATVTSGGIVKVKCGGGVTRGGLVASGANGLAEDAGTATEFTMGIALETGANGRIISMLWQPHGIS